MCAGLPPHNRKDVPALERMQRRCCLEWKTLIMRKYIVEWACFPWGEEGNDKYITL